MKDESVHFDISSTLASWILGLALGVPAAIILAVQLPMMSGGSEQASVNVTIAAVLLVVALAILTTRRRATLDLASKAVSWTRHLFGLTWRRQTIAADQVVAMAVLRDSGRAHLRTIWLIGRDGQRRVLKELATVHDQTVLERCARAMGWSVESDR